jgi:outer membrane protein assembly factor BamB
MVPSLVASGDIICCLGGRSGVAALAVRAGGSGDVTRTHRLWTGEKGSNVSSPVVSGKHLYWMNDQRETVYCAEVETGKVLYEERLNRAGQTYASALLAGGNIYYLTRDGQTYVVAAQPEFKLVATNDLGEGSLFNGSIAVAGAKLLIRSDKYLYCIGLK